MRLSTRTTCSPRCTTNSTTPLRLQFTTVWCVFAPKRLAATVLLLHASAQPPKMVVSVKVDLQAPSQTLLLLEVLVHPVLLQRVPRLPLLPLPKLFSFLRESVASICAPGICSVRILSRVLRS